MNYMEIRSDTLINLDAVAVIKRYDGNIGTGEPVLQGARDRIVFTLNTDLAINADRYQTLTFNSREARDKYWDKMIEIMNGKF